MVVLHRKPKPEDEIEKGAELYLQHRPKSQATKTLEASAPSIEEDAERLAENMESDNKK